MSETDKLREENLMLRKHISILVGGATFGHGQKEINHIQAIYLHRHIREGGTLYFPKQKVQCISENDGKVLHIHIDQ